jgi:outer membrane protein
MLKKMSGIVVLALATVFLAAGMASPTPAAAEVKIAVVDTQRAINECDAGKKAQVTLRRKADKLQADLKKLQDKVRQLREELENAAMLLKPEAKLRKEREFDRMAKELRERAQDAERELAQSKRQLFEPIVQNIAKVIKEIGQQGNYALILDTRSAIYWPKSVDVTAQVIDAYDKKFPAK